MKVLIFGYGYVGTQHAQALSLNPAIKEILICDPDASSSRPLPAKARRVNLKEALSKRCDAAVIATPHDAAFELLEKTAAKASAVLLEKPMGRNFAEAKKMLEAARKNSARLFVGFNYRYLRHIQELKRILSDKTYGKVLGVQMVLSHGALPGYETSWKTDKVRCGGGVCLDPGVHTFDLLAWLFGAAELQTGALARTYWPIQVEDHASLIFSIQKSFLASVELSISSWQSRFEITVELQEAQILLRGRGKYYGTQTLTVITKWPWLKGDEPRSVESDFGFEDFSFAAEMNEFVKAVRNPKASVSLATAQEALQTMKLVDDCYRLPILNSR